MPLESKNDPVIVDLNNYLSEQENQPDYTEEVEHEVIESLYAEFSLEDKDILKAFGHCEDILALMMCVPDKELKKFTMDEARFCTELTLKLREKMTEALTTIYFEKRGIYGQ